MQQLVDVLEDVYYDIAVARHAEVLPTLVVRGDQYAKVFDEVSNLFRAVLPGVFRVEVLLELGRDFLVVLFVLFHGAYRRCNERKGEEYLARFSEVRGELLLWLHELEQSVYVRHHLLRRLLAQVSARLYDQLVLLEHESVDLDFVLFDEVVTLAAVALRQYVEELVHEGRDLVLHERDVAVVDHNQHHVQNRVGQKVHQFCRWTEQNLQKGLHNLRLLVVREHVLERL